MHICIVTSSQLSANPRVVKEASALHNAGHVISIVCGDYISGAEEIDERLRHTEWMMHKVPFGRRAASLSAHLRQRLSMAVARRVVQMGARSAFVEAYAHAPVAKDLITATCAVQADLYIAHYVAALPAAAMAARRHGVVYAFDAEDFHCGDRPDIAEYYLEKQIIGAIEGRYLPHAAYVSAASPMIAEAYRDFYKIKLPTTVLNAFPRRSAAPAPTNRGIAEPGPSLYWFSQTIGPGRGLETAIEAIAMARSRPHLYLRGTSAVEYQNQLSALATNLEVTERLHFLDPAPPDELDRLGAAFDLGYSGESGFSANNTKALGNKLFSYLLGGLPILASDVASHRDFAQQVGPAMKLFPKGRASSLAALIDEFLLKPQNLTLARAHAWNLGQKRFNWEIEQEKLQRLVSSTMSALQTSPEMANR